eukprot:TRINITY_DN8514_c1_g1_i1.p1 TRINITY_DN8514_c1_g1~~TRINITY_DN8514_c1_g1_i1.p1  ORF type:complete len:558 (+),score=83.30 TRINITY_DN8514_c1_g1_i1:60-1676(+)
MRAVIATMLVAAVAGQCHLDINTQLADVGYVKSLNPAEINTASPTAVKVSSTVTKINEFNTKEQTYQINMYFRQNWVDERLAWGNNPSYVACNTTEMLKGVKHDQIWKPDTFFSNANGLMSPGGEEYVFVYRDGSVLWSRRIILTLFCRMDFHYFPFDQQTCKTTMESYGYSPEEMIFVKTSSADRFNETVAFMPGVGQVATYTLGVPKAEISTSVIGGNRFSTVSLIWVFDRSPDRALIPFSQIWLILLSSFLGCFINPEAAPARVAIALITVLTTINLLSGFAKDIPIVNYFTAMDYMYIICILFVVGNVFEYCIVNYALTIIKSNEGRIAELKKRRGATKQARSIHPSKKHEALAYAEVRELYSSFDIRQEDSITKEEFKALVVSAAADRGRSLDSTEIEHMMTRVGSAVSFREVYNAIRNNPSIGFEEEPRAALFFFSTAITRSTVERLEGIWRIWCPVLYIILNIIWFASAINRSSVIMFALGAPLLVIYFVALVVYVKRVNAYPDSNKKAVAFSQQNFDVDDTMAQELIPTS